MQCVMRFTHRANMVTINSRWICYTIWFVYLKYWSIYLCSSLYSVLYGQQYLNCNMSHLGSHCTCTKTTGCLSQFWLWITWSKHRLSDFFACATCSLCIWIVCCVTHCLHDLYYVMWIFLLLTHNMHMI